ncbi:MAG: hypothetical protein WCJ95_20075 [Mariniphaga sp.]
MIFGLAAMFGFYSYTGLKPWVTTNPGKAEVTPNIDKPWVITNQGKAEIAPCIEKPWVVAAPGNQLVQPNIY